MFRGRDFPVSRESGSWTLRCCATGVPSLASVLSPSWPLCKCLLYVAYARNKRCCSHQAELLQMRWRVFLMPRISAYESIKWRAKLSVCETCQDFFLMIVKHEWQLFTAGCISRWILTSNYCEAKLKNETGRRRSFLLFTALDTDLWWHQLDKKSITANAKTPLSTLRCVKLLDRGTSSRGSSQLSLGTRLVTTAKIDFHLKEMFIKVKPTIFRLTVEFIWVKVFSVSGH